MIIVLTTAAFGCLEQQSEYPAEPIQTEALPPQPADGQKVVQEKVPEPASNVQQAPPPRSHPKLREEASVTVGGKVVADDDVNLVGKTIQVDLSGYGNKGGGYFGSTFLTQPGSFEIRAPKNAGAVHLTVYVGDAGAGPLDRLSCIFEPFEIGSEDIDDIELKIEKDKLMKVADMPRGQTPDPSSASSPRAEEPATGADGPPPAENRDVSSPREQSPGVERHRTTGLPSHVGGKTPNLWQP